MSIQQPRGDEESPQMTIIRSVERMADEMESTHYPTAVGQAAEWWVQEFAADDWTMLCAVINQFDNEPYRNWHSAYSFDTSTADGALKAMATGTISNAVLDYG